MTSIVVPLWSAGGRLNMEWVWNAPAGGLQPTPHEIVDDFRCVDACSSNAARMQFGGSLGLGEEVVAWNPRAGGGASVDPASQIHRIGPTGSALQPINSRDTPCGFLFG